MSVRASLRGGVRATAVLLVIGALVTGCNSDDDDDDGTTGGSGGGGGGGGMTDPGMPDPGPTGGAGLDGGDGTFAAILGLGPTDEPVDFDAAALSADLETVFGAATDDGLEFGEGDDTDASGRRTATR